jgi:hypothetical protein
MHKIFLGSIVSPESIEGLPQAAFDELKQEIATKSYHSRHSEYLKVCSFEEKDDWSEEQR